MSVWKWIATAAVVAAPLVVVSAPAEALTARQYQSQGYGVYTTSKNRVDRYRRRYYGPRAYGRPYYRPYYRPYHRPYYAPY